MTLSLNDVQKREVAKAALVAANRRGYCDETKKVLADLGLPTDVDDTKTITATVELTFEVPNNGHSVILDNNRISYHSQTGRGKLKNVRVVDGRGVNRSS